MRLRLARFLLPALLAVASAWAHQQQEAVTRVLFNPRTGNIEVMHRFLLHDVEHAVGKLRQAKTDILNSEQDRVFFADYVHAGFSIADQDGHTLPLSPVGQEIEGRFLWVYSETPVPANIKTITITHGALLDVWPRQVNLVNVERNGEVRSAIFTSDDKVAVIDLDSR